MGQDVRAFVKYTLQARIDEYALLSGNVPEQLKEQNEDVFTSRAGISFLYASLLIKRLCD